MLFIFEQTELFMFEQTEQFAAVAPSLYLGLSCVLRCMGTAATGRTGLRGLGSRFTEILRHYALVSKSLLFVLANPYRTYMVQWTWLFQPAIASRGEECTADESTAARPD